MVADGTGGSKGSPPLKIHGSEPSPHLVWWENHRRGHITGKFVTLPMDKSGKTKPSLKINNDFSIVYRVDYLFTTGNGYLQSLGGQTGEKAGSLSRNTLDQPQLDRVVHPKEICLESIVYTSSCTRSRYCFHE